MKGRKERMMTTGREVVGRSAPNKVIPGGQPPRVLDRDILWVCAALQAVLKGLSGLGSVGEKAVPVGEIYIAGAS